ncbi:helix-turn-helix domain-containing protein [Chryseobacterium sp. 09-1422]|uniref:Helix-turn-helix domain-containing protein n=1 Tax=Chryseobacterium kimseyorum TaxID=2984028 RepID=A0ABT3I3Q7_9FLAO|nr:helix-turn-helix domain-containing protein [Chryseobacterium kimseyorum]MCW3170700.1 helix-turn-helix domain-containing protein [Chryseobacterium kimseyorum]
MKTIVRQLREEKKLTQSELAEKSGLSLRTIQRIEAGNIPKGFTFKTLALSLQTEPENLFITEEHISTDRAKLINLSALSGLIIPFGGIIFPLILTLKTKDKKNKELGENILCVQILAALVISVSMIISPFIQKILSVEFPIFIIPLLLFIILKLFIIIKNGISLNTKNELSIKLKINFI